MIKISGLFANTPCGLRIDNMKPYPAYKESGIEWLGDVPQKWDIKRLKFVSQINPSKPSDIPENLPCVFIPMEAMNTDGTFDQSERRPFSELKNGFTHFAKDDVIFAKITPCFENGKGALLSDLDSEIGFGSTEFHVLRAVTGRTTSKFLYYLTSSGEFRRIGEGLMQGVAGQKRVTNDFVQDYVVAVPSIDEQRSIAEYLDHKTAQIDDLIAKKERMIELLKEERTAIIDHTVTKGLDLPAPQSEAARQAGLNVELSATKKADPSFGGKDSGVDWLGKVPKHWCLKKLKYVSCVNRKALSETVDENYEFNYVDIGNVDLEEGIAFGEKISFLNAPSRARRIVQKGDAIVSTVRTYLKAIAYFEDDVEDIIVSTGFAVISPKRIFNPKFLYYVLRSEKFIDRVCAQSVGVSYPAINSTELSDIVIWFPEDRVEQSKIVEYLDRVISKTKMAIRRYQKEIEYLKEYRTALISEVVTGKIDVRTANEK